ncbi:MAG: hypothetical protein U9O82_05050 [Thermodesulfobacteriota bacterium]|nr:hypothetical protein [Thermodesulfobacteriota bacterium]
MKKAVKGALLSGLVYPGLGQVVLGRPGTGIAFILAATAGIGMIIYKIMTSISLIMDQTISMVENGGVSFNKIVQISMNVTQSGFSLFNSAPILFFLCWLGSIIHAYFVGDKLDRIKDRFRLPPKLPPHV